MLEHYRCHNHGTCHSAV